MFKSQKKLFDSAQCWLAQSPTPRSVSLCIVIFCISRISPWKRIFSAKPLQPVYQGPKRVSFKCQKISWHGHFKGTVLGAFTPLDVQLSISPIGEPLQKHCCILLHIVAYCCMLLHIVAYCCILLHIVAYCCILLHIVAYCCILLQCHWHKSPVLVNNPCINVNNFGCHKVMKFI